MASYQTLVNPANLTFDDEFNTFLSSPDGSVGWMTSYNYGGESARALPSNGEAQYFSDSSVGVNPFSDANGVLTITATVAAPGSNPYGLPYNSGMITSYTSLSQIYGYFEIDAELPAGQGLWPAFYLLPTDVANQHSEIDVFEVLGNAPGTVYATVHWEVNGVWNATTTIVNVANTSAGFNTYGVDWEPTTTTIYMDGQVIASFATTPQMDQPMYMLAGLQVGSAGSWPGAPSSSAEFPATMEINYIRAYATANTIDVSGTQAIETAAITGQLMMAGVGWAGATVKLLNAAGTVIATTTTNAAGTFSFAHLAAGDYQLHYALPPGLAVQNGSPAAAGTGLTGTLTLTDGQTLSLPAEVLLAPATPATIQSSVSLFGGAGDTTLLGSDAGVTVSLLDGSGNVIAGTVSAANGSFSFGNLAAGTYQLEYTPPAGQTIQPGSNANAATGLTALFSVAAGQTVTAPGGAMVSLGSIDGMVVLNGVGEAGVTVAVLNTAGAVVATDTTNGMGDFAFTDLLAAGTYQLKYTAPSGQVFQTGGAANATTGITSGVALATSQVLTVATEQLLSNPGKVSAATLNYGAPTDNSWGTGEGGVTVSLLNAAGVVIATTVTPGWGGFSFGGLAAGTYQLQYTAPAGQAFLPGGSDNPTSGLTAQFTVVAGQDTVAPYGQLVTLSSIGGTVLLNGADEANARVALLNAAGSVVATTATNSAGAFTFTDLAPGSYQVDYTAPAGTVLQAGSEANAATGLTAAITLGYSQTVSLPAEQLQTILGMIQASVLAFGSAGGSAAGSADAGVTVSLLNAAGTVIATAVSGSNGGVTFSNVTPGTYQLGYTAPSGQAIEPGGLETASTGLTAPFTVAAGQTVTAPTGDLLTDCLAGAVTLAGAAEAGVTVSLLSTAGKVLATTTTNSAGVFSFAGLAAGSYEVKYTAPSGQVFQTGSEASAATGITPVFALAANQGLALPTEQLLSNPGTISLVVEHYGATTDNAWGSGMGGVTVSLLSAAGAVIATTVSNSSGAASFHQIGPGTYQLEYTAPAGQGFLPGGPENPATGLTAQFTVAAGQTFNAPMGELISTIVMNGTGLTEVAPAGGYLVTGNASDSTLTMGNGTQYITLTGGGDSVTTGNGNQIITLSGNDNTVTFGNGGDTIMLTGTGNTVFDTGVSGTSTINAGSGDDTVHVTGGTDNITINATGSGNLFDAGPGLNFLNADGSSGNVFMLNAAAATNVSLTTITGFNPAADDILDLKRTLAGTDILPNLSNVGSLVTASSSGANTLLYVNPTGHSAMEFAVLDGIHVTVAQLLAAKELSLT